MNQPSLNYELAELVVKCRKLADRLRQTWDYRIAPATHPILQEFEQLEAEANEFLGR